MASLPLVFTVDVETDWGTAATRGLDEAMPWLLERLRCHGARATFFVVGTLAARFRTAVDPAGPHEVAAHGHTHVRLDALPPMAVEDEVIASRRALESHGYAVRGFRAPFLRRPPGFASMLSRCGFGYDASGGSVVPSLRNLCARRGEVEGVAQLPPSTLADGLTPFSLTWLRLLHPLGRRMVPARARVFFCHLHELLDPSPAAAPGWHRLPALARRVHARHCGRLARSLVEGLLADRGRTAITCSEYLRQVDRA